MSFTKLLTNGFRSSFEIPEVRYELGNSLRNCQSNRELGNVVVNFITKFRWEVKKFISREVRAIRCNCLGIFLDVVTTIRNYWLILKWVIKRCN